MHSSEQNLIPETDFQPGLHKLQVSSIKIKILKWSLKAENIFRSIVRSDNLFWGDQNAWKHKIPNSPSACIIFTSVFVLND